MEKNPLYDVNLLRPFVGIPADVSAVARFPEMAEAYYTLSCIVPDDLGPVETILLSKHVRTKALVDSKIEKWANKMSVHAMAKFNDLACLLINSYKEVHHDKFLENKEDKFVQEVYLKSLVNTQKYVDFLMHLRQQRLDVFPQDRLQAFKSIEVLDIDDGEEIFFDEDESML